MEEGDEGGEGDPEATPSAAPEGIADLVKTAKEILAKIEGMTAAPAAQADEGEEGEEGEQGMDEGEGPDAGVNAQAADSGLRGFYADSAAKETLYGRLSKIVGAFEHKSMTAADMAVYGCSKLGIKVKAGHAVALDAYLSGAEKAAKQFRTQPVNKASDAAVGDAAMDSYLKESV